MKNNAWFKIFMVSAFIMVPGSAFAEVEHMPIKSSEAKANEALAKQNLKLVDTAKIQDPEAKKAINEILRYLKLEAKK